METTYGFPKTDPGAVLAAADELSRRHRGGSLRRLHADNTIDLVCLRGFLRKGFLVYRIKSDGTHELVEETSAPFIFVVAAGLMAAGIALFAGTVISVLARRPEQTPNETDLAFGGFLLAAVGALLARHYELESFVSRRFGTEEGWQRIAEPTTWLPRTALQLRRVESIARNHGGKAWVRTLADGTAEVAVRRFLRDQHYRVFHDGAFVYVEEETDDRGEWHPVRVAPEPSDD